MKYGYIVKGTNGKGDLWVVTGTVNVSNFAASFGAACGEAFMKLTKGETTYGHPGEGGCDGPYKLISCHIDEAEDLFLCRYTVRQSYMKEGRQEYYFVSDSDSLEEARKIVMETKPFFAFDAVVEIYDEEMGEVVE